MYQQISLLEQNGIPSKGRKITLRYGRRRIVCVCGFFAFLVVALYLFSRSPFHFNGSLLSPYDPVRNVTLSHVDCPFLPSMLKSAEGLRDSLENSPTSVSFRLAKSDERKIGKIRTDIASINAEIASCSSDDDGASRAADNVDILNRAFFAHGDPSISNYFGQLERMKENCDDGVLPDALLAAFFSFSRENDGLPPRGFCKAVSARVKDDSPAKAPTPLPNAP